MSWRGGVLLGVVFAAHLLSAGDARGQQVREVRWGFDGRSAPGHFNFVSVLVDNPGSGAIQGDLVLTKSSGIGRLGARQVEPCFMAPQSSRLIQFFPYVTSHPESWNLGWNRSGIRGGDVPDLRRGNGRAVVLLESDDPLARPLEDIRSFPAAWFPTMLGATETLSDAILDHAPDWEGPRRDAFLGWLRSGGRLHLLQNGGRYPRFSAELSILNEVTDDFRIGSGRVIRYTMSRAATTVGRLDLAAQPDADPDDNFFTSLTPSILGELQAGVSPDINWGLIFLVAIVFLIVVGPLHWSISRTHLDYRLSIVALLVVIGLFTWIFRALGARGYGEQASVLTLAYAKSLDEESWDVFQYSNTFVTTGDFYRIENPGDAALFSCAQVNEAVAGAIDNGRGASLVVDIPLFSSRPFVHRSTLDADSGARAEISVERWVGNRGLRDLALRLPAGFPPDGAMLSAWAAHRGQIVEMDSDGTRLTPLRAPISLSQFLDLQNLRQMGGYLGYGMAASLTGVAVERRFRDQVGELIKPMLVDRLHLASEENELAFNRQEQVTLLILARTPGSFNVRGEGLGREESYIVYHVDVFEPEH